MFGLDHKVLCNCTYYGCHISKAEIWEIFSLAATPTTLSLSSAASQCSVFSQCVYSLSYGVCQTWS